MFRPTHTVTSYKLFPRIYNWAHTDSCGRANLQPLLFSKPLFSLKSQDNTKFGTDHQSVQPGAEKVSRNKTFSA